MDTKKKNSMFIGCLCALSCEIIFGFSYIFTKQVTVNASAFSLLGWRFIFAFIVMSICVLSGAIKVNLKGKNLKPLLLVAFFSPIMYFVGETIGISNTTASESGVFLACIPAVSLLASTLILRKKPNKKQVFGISLTLIGVLTTLFAVGMSASFSGVGYLFLLLAVISYALYSVFVERANEYTSGEITVAMITAGTIVFSILAIIESHLNQNMMDLIRLPFSNINFLIGTLYQGIGCSVVAFFLSNIAIAKIGVNQTSSFIGIATVTSIIAGVLLLKERFSVYQIIGAIIIIIGVYIANTNNNIQ